MRYHAQKQRIVAELIARQNGYCPICCKPIVQREANLDHIVPRSLGGINKPWNMRATHRWCNARRGSEPEASEQYAKALNRHRRSFAHLTEARYHSSDADPPPQQ